MIICGEMPVYLDIYSTGDLGGGSSVRVPAYQVRGPEFKLQYCQKTTLKTISVRQSFVFQYGELIIEYV
jgi:hypothetical protein